MHFSGALRSLALIALLLLLAACVPITDNRSPTVQAEQEAAANATAEPDVEASEALAAGSSAPRPTRILRIGVDVGFPPFTYLDDSGRLVGFEIDLMNALTSLGDFEVAYLPMAFDQLLPSLRSGTIDVAMGALTVNENRREVVDFTDPYFGQGQSAVSYFSGGQGLAVSESSTFTSIEEFGPEQRVGVKRYTTGEDWVEANMPSIVVPFETAEEALQALAAGDLDGVVVDIAVIAGFLRSGEVSGVRLGAGPLTDEQYAMAVNLGQTETLDLLNNALKSAEGPVFDALIEHWFGGS